MDLKRAGFAAREGVGVYLPGSADGQRVTHRRRVGVKNLDSIGPVSPYIALYNLSQGVVPAFLRVIIVNGAAIGGLDLKIKRAVGR